jgi:hypothetical protein
MTYGRRRMFADGTEMEHFLEKLDEAADTAEFELEMENLMAAPNRRRLRANTARRFNTPSSGSLNEDGKGEAFGTSIYGCTPCVLNRKLCHKNIVPDDGSCSYLGFDNWWCKC